MQTSADCTKWRFCLSCKANDTNGFWRTSLHSHCVDACSSGCEECSDHANQLSCHHAQLQPIHVLPNKGAGKDLQVIKGQEAHSLSTSHKGICGVKRQLQRKIRTENLCLQRKPLILILSVSVSELKCSVCKGLCI